MKKIILISIIFILTLNLSYADCKTKIEKKYYWLKNLESIILNIWKKITKNSDKTKLIKFVWVLKNIEWKSNKQKRIINLLKDYFKCKIINLWSNDLINKNWDFFKITYNNPDNLNWKFWLKNQVEDAIKNNKTSIQINYTDNYSWDIKAIWSINNCWVTKNNNWCSTNWNYYKIYIPKEAEIVSFLISSTPTRPTWSYILMNKFIEDWRKWIINFDDFEDNKSENNLLYSSKVVKWFFHDTKKIFLSDYNIDESGWLYIAISQKSSLCWESNYFSSCNLSRNLSLSSYIQFKDILKMQDFIAKTNFDTNWNPFVYKVDFNNLKKCDWIQNIFSCDQVNIQSKNTQNNINNWSNNTTCNSNIWPCAPN